jgi:Flp pilus assembly protein TadD
MSSARRHRQDRPIQARHSSGVRAPVGILLRLSVCACCALSACASINAQRQPTMSAEARLQVAEAADSSGDTELAISMYTAAAASEPANTNLQLRCADALARRGKIDEARKLLAERLRTSPGQPDLVRALALIDLVAGQPARAITELDQILAANPADVRALVDKGVALDLLGQHAAAQAIYQQVLATSPNDAAAKNDLALSLMLEGRTRQALDTLAPMQNVAGSSQRLRTNLGILYAATGDVQRSRELLGDRAANSEVSALTRAMGTPPP